MRTPNNPSTIRPSRSAKPRNDMVKKTAKSRPKKKNPAFRRRDYFLLDRSQRRLRFFTRRGEKTNGELDRLEWLSILNIGKRDVV